MKKFTVTQENINKVKADREQTKPFSPKASTCLSMQETLSNALGSRMPQNNGASIVQPGTNQGFGRSV